MMHIWHASIIFTFTGVLMVFNGLASGQSVTLSVPPVVERGTDTVFTCTGGTSPYSFTWSHLSGDNAGIIYNDGEKSQDPNYSDFTISENGDTSIMTIMNTMTEDEGRYSCSEGLVVDAAEFTVEARYTLSLDLVSTIENNIDMYSATFDAVNGRPDLPITWMLGDGGSPCDSIDETHLTAPTDLFSKRSVCTFQATRGNYEETLRCNISGYQLSDLTGAETFTLDIHSAPASTGIMEVVFQFQDPDLRVSCDIATADQPNPIIRNYYIYRNGSLILQSDTGVNFVVVPETEFDIYTELYCVAGNYLGNTTSQPDRYNPTKYQVPPGTIILAVLLPGSIIAIISAILFIVWRRYARRSGKNGPQQVTSSDVRVGSNEANDNMAYEMIQSGDRAYTPLKLSSSGTSRSATIDPENVAFFTRLGSIGRGDFGAVWKGELRSNQCLAAVAIRQIPDHVSKSTNMLQSVKILCELSDQPNVVKCIGFCQEQSSIIYEFISGGTLLTHLQMAGVQSQTTYSNLKPNRVRIDEGSLLNFAWQIAKGMQFLASKKIIHGTLCAHNVLLGERKQCKLSDYGLASSLFSNRGKPTRWSSPETMVTGVQSTEGDIWSFGIVLWEIVTLGARPYPNMTFDTVQKEVSNGYKMPRPRHCGQELYTIMSRCWETEGRKRIRFDEILKTLERILEKTHDYLSLSDLDKDFYASPLDV